MGGASYDMDQSYLSSKLINQAHGKAVRVDAASVERDWLFIWLKLTGAWVAGWQCQQPSNSLVYNHARMHARFIMAWKFAGYFNRLVCRLHGHDEPFNRHSGAYFDLSDRALNFGYQVAFRV